MIIVDVVVVRSPGRADARPGRPGRPRNRRAQSAQNPIRANGY